MKYNNQIHPFHLVDPSPWPLIASIGAFSLTSGTVMFFHGYNGGTSTFFFGIFLILLMMFVWWRDIVREATFEGNHTKPVELGLRMGMLLFIVSEVMLFFAFFWAFFYASIAPGIELGTVWPPQGIEVFNAWEVPFLNTLILLTSGATCTLCHNTLVTGDKKLAVQSLIATIVLAALFTGFQAFEYMHASFTISDSIYGSCFYMATGFHGAHVFIGTCFLTVCLVRLIKNHFTRQHHFGFEAAAWYWHFVDVVWLFLFVAVYWWGGN
jgi:heme/copper-type cytochrome/quinol oxidase subunit 3